MSSPLIQEPDAANFRSARDAAKSIDKAELFSLVGKLEWPGFFANLALMEDHYVMAEMVELELLERGNNLLAIVLLIEDAKC